MTHPVFSKKAFSFGKENKEKTMADLTALERREIFLGKKTPADFGIKIRPLTREQKIERVAQKILDDDLINPKIFQNALREGGLTSADGKEVMEKAKELWRKKNK